MPRASGSGFTPLVAVRRRRQLTVTLVLAITARQRGTLEIGETYEDDLNGTQWADVRGRKQPWGTIAFDLSAIVSSTPIDDWKPTSEEFEGYTGNAGNTLDRWYHRSALVVWHRDHHFDVVASSGAADSIPLFCSMTAKLAKTPKKRLEEARNDCIRFARAIIDQWPRRMGGYWHSAPGETSPYADFPEQLLKLHDRDAIALFLSKAAEQDQTLRLDSFVVAACREFGWNAFAPELKQLLASRPDAFGRPEIPFRDVEWLSAFCCDDAADSDKSALAQELCALAVERFCEPRSPQARYYSPHHRKEPRCRNFSAVVAQGAGRKRSRRRSVAGDSLRPGIAGRIQPGRLPGSLLEIVDTVVAKAVRRGSLRN